MPGDTPRRPALVLMAGAQEWSSRSLESVLAPQGYAILRAFTDRQTVEHARSGGPDAIILDIGLPEAGGLATCRTLRTDPLITPSTPIILIAPEAETRTQRLDALRAGASEFWGQPLDTEEVVLRLEHLVTAKRDADEARTDTLRDAASGLYNARGLEHRLHELAALASRRHAALACVVFELERPDPRRPEDPVPGPRTSELMVEALRSASRGSDAVGRLGTSEFAVVAPEADVDGAAVLAERLARVLARLSAQSGRPQPPRLRAGLDGVPDFAGAGIPADELLRRANAALRAAAPGEGTWLRRFAPAP